MSTEDVDPARRALAAALERARRLGRRPPGRRPPASGGLSGAAADELDPQPLGAGIARLVEEQGWTPTMPSATVMGAWDQLVGADIAAHCRPERLVDGELRLVAESTAWATQLRLLSGPILARLHDALGDDVVRRLRITGPVAPSWQRGPRRVTGRGPRDTYG